MKLEIEFSTTFPDGSEYSNPHELIFNEGDFYNIYHHAIADKELETKQGLSKFFAFQVLDINQQFTVIKQIFSPEQTITIERDGKAHLDLQNFGILQLKTKTLD